MVTGDADLSRRNSTIRSSKDVAGWEGLGDPIDQVGLLVDKEFGGFRKLGNGGSCLKWHPRDVVEQPERS